MQARPTEPSIPGLKELADYHAPGPIPEEAYVELLMTEWQRFLGSPESHEEAQVQAFLEQNPSLLPGLHSSSMTWSGRSPFPLAVISQPKLPGLSDRRPDFMWIAMDSGSLYPILIEIETPHKKWFRGKRAEVHSDLTHAQSQLAEWRAWFNKGHNRTAFLDYYEVPQSMARLQMRPRYVLVHGRRSDFENDLSRTEKRAELARDGETLMSFDRLSPVMQARMYASVVKQKNGYLAKRVPAAWALQNHGEPYAPVSGWLEALAASPDMAAARRDFIGSELKKLRVTPNFYVNVSSKGMRTRTPKVL